MIVSLLAVLKAGGAYVPLDPAYPVERLRFMLEDCAPIALLTENHLTALFPEARSTLPVIDLHAASLWHDQPVSNPDGSILGLSCKHLAYVIYTSGSTGLPKGVMVEHQGIVNRLVWMQCAYEMHSDDAVFQKTPFSFDVSLWEFFWPLLAGARLVIARPEGHKDAAYLVEAIQRNSITMLHFVPSMLQAFLEHANRRKCSTLRRVMCSGEALPFVLAQSFQKRLSAVTLHNLYGPTEAAVDVTAWTCPPGISESIIPIGRPIANTRIYILDGHGEPVPVGVAGELYIGGAGVARGYLNQPELTADRFLADPYAAGAHARMYKTGDQGRWRADGNVEFLGRNDYQVKVRGYRIELGEIEARLREHPGVREAVVTAREDTPGDKRLVAYYIPVSSSNSEMDIEGIRSHLSALLPEYMVPAAYVRLDALPLTPNGKLDRKALPAPEQEAYASRGYEAPQGETETVLAQIWSEVLKLDRVGRQDNFFELGGHSLLAVRVISRLRQLLSIEVAMRDLFARPVLADLARGLKGAAYTELPPITAAERSERIPLSFAQQRLWFLAQMGGVSEAYHISFGLYLHGELDHGAFRRALDRILARHEALRTTFVVMDGEPVQRISSRDSCFSLLEHDLRQHMDPLAELDCLVTQEATASFDLEAGPLIRGRLVRLAEDQHAVLITMHHIVSDGWSMGVLTHELSALYRSFLQGQADPLAEPTLQYADYAIWQREWIEGGVLQQQADYWKTTLAAAPALLEVPLDHARPAEQDYTGAFAGLVLEEELTAALKAFSKRHGTTLFMTLLAGWAALLTRLSGQQDVVIGTPVANRGHSEIEGLIGFFVITLPLRLDLSGSLTVSELLDRVKAQTLAAQQHQDIPFEQVVELARPVRSLAHSPLFQAMFVWQHASQNTLELPGLEIRALPFLPPVVSKFDLTLSLQEAGRSISGGLEYATALFEQSTIERYLGHFRTLLEAMVKDDTQTVSRLPLLSQGERHQVIEGWNDTAVEYPSAACIHELFEAQVARSPEATAVVFEEATLSYGELNCRANQLAHYLRALGVKPDTRVAICVERSFEMIVSLLAVLKAGGAYVPLDPAYPVERLRFMLEDCAPIVLLTENHLTALFPEARSTLPVIDLHAASLWHDQPVSNPDGSILGLSCKHLAYVIYTSGSTGLPKGVMIPHSALVNFLRSIHQEIGGEPNDIFLAITTVSFDIAGLELYLPLTIGARLKILDSKSSMDGDLLLNELKQGVTVLQATPTTWRMLLEAGWRGTEKLKVLCGGEALGGDLAKELSDKGTSAWNMYGPTETTIWSLLYSLGQITNIVPIGRPIANTRIYILDGHGEPVPVGVAGELYIGGAGVARGYLNQPELTADCFLADPYAAGVHARMYKTGDRGRWRADGNIEFLGRNDYQVKVRGYRIELGEIEARLREHPGVREAVVTAREDTPGDKRLVAYYIPVSPSDSEMDIEGIRTHLPALLPEYMVPAAYVRLDALPLTPNGKLDRKALPAPEQEAYASRGYEAPQGETETVLAQIWSEVLKLDRVGRQDNFFELGGHSLLAVRVISRLRQLLSIEVAMRDLFARPVLADLARGLKGAAYTELPPITAAERSERIPLSFAQQRLWFLAQMGGVSEAYHISFGLYLHGELDHGAFRRALDRILARHEALRTTFVVMDGEPVQRISSRDSCFSLLEHDLRQHMDPLAELDCLVTQEATASFDLEAGPLIRGRLVRLAEDQHAVLITMHHIVSDGWSMGVLTHELSALYRSFLQGQADPLAEPTLQYADYAIWQREWIEGEVLQQQADYWKTTLAAAPALLEVPLDHARPAEQDYTGAFAGLVL